MVPGGPRLGRVVVAIAVVVVVVVVGVVVAPNAVLIRTGGVAAWVVVLFGGVALVGVVPGSPRVGGVDVVEVRVGMVRIGALGAGVVVVRLNLRVGAGVVGRVGGFVFSRVGFV